MSKKYYVIEEKSNDGCGAYGCLIALIAIFLVIAAIVAVIALIFAAIVTFILTAIAVIIGTILTVSAITGSVVAIKNYVLAMRDSISDHRYDDAPSWWFLPQFVYRWIVIAWDATKGSWLSNIESMKDYFSRTASDGFGFKAMIHAFTALSVLIFGSLAAVGLMVAQFSLVLTVLSAMLFAIVVAGGLFALVGSVMALIHSVKHYFTAIRETYYNTGDLFTEYMVKHSFRELWTVIKDYWSANVEYIRDNFSDASPLPFLSIRKWFCVWNALMVAALGTVLLPLYTLLYVVALAALFVVCGIISLFQRR